MLMFDLLYTMLATPTLHGAVGSCRCAIYGHRFAWGVQLGVQLWVHL